MKNYQIQIELVMAELKVKTPKLILVNRFYFPRNICGAWSSEYFNPKLCNTQVNQPATSWSLANHLTVRSGPPSVTVHVMVGFEETKQVGVDTTDVGATVKKSIVYMGVSVL